MRLPSHLRSRDRFDGAMTPMIDVVFLLLVFFVWTASFQIVEHLLPSHLSAQAGTAESTIDQPPPDLEQVVVTIAWQGTAPSWQVNGNAVSSLAEVRQTLITVAQITAEVPLIVDPDRQVPFGHVIDIYDAARSAGFDKIQLAASEEI